MGGTYIKALSHYSLRHAPPLEQGGASHRSSRPQQVLPVARWDVWSVNDPGERILLISRLPQFLQHMGSSFPEITRYSEIVPHASHRYS